jgi:hypothetical protein
MAQWVIGGGDPPLPKAELGVENRALSYLQ